MRTIAFDVDGRRIELSPTRMYNVGSATRDPEAARAHQEEVAEIGIRIAFDVPSPRIYPVAISQAVTDTEVAALHGESSGEVEIVIVVDGSDIYVGVGSDHTDRWLERTSIPWSKNVSPNVVAPELWRWQDVADHWDECVMSSHVDGRPYQEAAVSIFLTPPEILEVLAERVDLPSSYVVFCGSYAAIDKIMRFGDTWELALTDPVRDRAIRHTYRVIDLFTEIREGFRVPVVQPD